MRWAFILAVTLVLAGTGCAGSGISSGAVPRQLLRPNVRHGSAHFAVLHSFLSGKDGAQPLAGPTMVNGTLYGTTYTGGSERTVCDCGAIYTIDAAGAESIIYHFRGLNKANPSQSDGALPEAPLVEFNGKLYGTTSAGGDMDPYYGCTQSATSGCGTIFYLDSNGLAHVIYRFTGGTDGVKPTGNLAVFDNKLYGTTVDGGALSGSYACHCGTIFSLTASGKEKVVHRFDGATDGAYPQAGLSVVDGKLYGTAPEAGSSKSCVGCGTVFSLDARGRFSTVFMFDNHYTGEQPDSTIVQVGKTLYGTTYSGGNRGYCGTIFSIDASGEHNVYDFGCLTDGKYPGGSLTVLNGVIYGTTLYGGGTGCYLRRGCGTIFAFDTSSGQEAPAYTFRAADGGDALGITKANGIVYGAAHQGGAKNWGTVFSLTP